MAILKDGSFHPSGTFGDIVYRQRNGKTVMYRRPQNQKVSRTEAAIYARDSFTLTTKFAVFINSFPYLKLTWKKARVKGSNHFQKIIKNNAHIIKKVGVSTNSKITPEGIPFDDIFVSLSTADNRISITLKVTGEINRIVDPSFILHILFYFSDPKRKTTALYNFSGIANEISYIPADGIYNLTFTLDETARSYLKSYKRLIVFTAACSSEPVGKKIFWTTTYAKEFKL